MHDDARNAASPPDACTAQRRLLPGEFSRVALAFAAFFLLLCGYYILRPVRDTMAAQFGADRLHHLFTATFLFTLLAVPAFGWVVRRTPREYVLPLVYAFLVVNLLGFQAAFSRDAGALAGAAFFVWLSVFNLLSVSLFWSTMGDCFSTAESHRLYGYVSAGGTAGALAGPALAALVATRAGSAHLLALSAALLAAAAACVMALRRRKCVDRRADPQPLGGAIIAGIPLAVKLRDMRAIAMLVLAYTTVSTVLYAGLVEHAAQAFPGANERTRFFAAIDLAGNSLALALQMIGTRKIVRRFGVRAALSIVPALAIAGLGALGAMRGMPAFAAMQTLHRAGEYALGRPGREMIYTTVDAETRYKAKNFIDTAVYRAGDAGSAWIIAAARSAGMDAVLFVALPAALLWLAIGFRLGGRHDRHEPT